MSDKLTPYSVTQGKEFFDWNAFLARDPYSIGEQEWDAAQELALKFVTCAVGQQCSIIPRRLGGTVPEDSKLHHLGLNFYALLERDTFPKARNCLLKIESRSAYLIKQIAKKTL